MEAKDTILQKTFNLLLIKGFDAVSISDIQEASGLSRGLLYHYFRNKEELFIQVTEKYFLEIFDFNLGKTKNYNLSGFTDFICRRFRKIEKTIMNIASQSANKADVTILNYHFLSYQVIHRDVQFRARYRATLEKEKAGWQQALHNSISAGEIKPGIDVEVAANQLYTLTNGVWFQVVLDDDAGSMVDKLEESLLQYIGLLR
ncbi:TetR/AcrR family transcriptional regulator [Dysgonomonas sp. 511]|uniref:TetR/AcrR family transcriptional regulator n=1 Tax=Dysgonomonas sp. 511 TaxID=2302930 RepID=UPI0013D442F6|nr:TetR/AcrR family transcriptional regulator [Dysgonomonas sp. 511]NDV78248.1 TetR/AcrR family transcriptional regulator [Dysgonomonas sp. 511]